MRKMCKKNLILSVIALLLAMMISIGATYSWIEDISKVELNTSSNNGENIPLTVGENIAGVYEVTNDNAYINLGTAWTTNATTNQREIESNAVRAVDGKTINGRKGYYYEAGDMHLTPCLGDGQEFYFHKDSSHYIAGNHDNANVDYVSSTIQVSSPTAKTEFWFDENSIDFKLYNGSTQITNADDYIRVAIIVDGIKKIYSNNGAANSNGYYTIDNGSKTKKTDIKAFSEYTHYANTSNCLNTSNTRGANGNTLFTIGKGETKTVTFRVWLEDDTAVNNVDKANLKMRLISSWAFTRDITIKDKTTSADAASWLVGKNNSNTDKIFLAIPAAKVNNQWQEGVSYWSVGLTDTVHEATVQNIPAVYNGEKMFLYRCNSQWNGSISSGFNAKSNDQQTKNGMFIDEGGVNAWNFWRTNLPDSFVDVEYTVYGGSLDNIIADQNMYNLDQTNQGYGTWDGATEIKFKSAKMGDNQQAAPWIVDKNSKLIVEDYSDYETTGEIHYSIMYCYDQTNGHWKIYLPTTSTKIGLKYMSDNPNGDYGRLRIFGYITQSNATTVVPGRTKDNPAGYERSSTNGNLHNVFQATNTTQDYPNNLYTGEWKYES